MQQDIQQVLLVMLLLADIMTSGFPPTACLTAVHEVAPAIEDCPEQPRLGGCHIQPAFWSHYCLSTAAPNSNDENSM